MVVCFVVYMGMWQMRFHQVAADKASMKLALGFLPCARMRSRVMRLVASVCVRICMYVNKKTGCLVPYLSKIFC